MRKTLNSWKAMMLMGTTGMLFGVGGSCLPDNFFADKAGEILNGLIIFGVNTALTGTGVTI